MPSPLELFGLSLPSLPVSGREEPAVWVRRLAFWPDREGTARFDVQLRRGLNIVWSPDRRPDGARDLGHGAGKTLFCRLLRFCLGEATFANADIEDRVQRAFPHGLVGAQVVVAGVEWAVVRRVNHLVGGTASREASIDDLRAGDAGDGFDEYVDALQASAVPPSALNLLPDGRRHNPWLYALASISRDQECRATGLLHWRHKDSEARSPVRIREVSGETRLQALRVFLGGFSDRERELLAQRGALSEERAENERAAAGLQREVRRLRAELGALLSLPESEVTADPMSLHRLGELARERIVEAQRAALPGHDVELSAWEIEHTALTAQRGRLKAQLEALDANLKGLRATREILRGQLAEVGQRVRDVTFNLCPVSGTPIDKVKAEGCGIALPDPSIPEKEREDIRGALGDLERELVGVEAARSTANGELEGIKSDVDALHGRISRRKEEHARSSEAVRASWTASGHVGLFGRRAEELGKTNGRVQDLEAEERGLLGDIEKERTAQAVAFGAVTTWFDWVIRSMVGGDATGALRLDGNGLRASVESDGTDRSSAAINSLKVAAFDLAAMLASASGRGSLPRLVVHDSPREADLGIDIYQNLFAMVRGLELGEVSPFQYIVTTTTAPPDDLQRDPWIVLRLSGSVAGERLLRTAL